MRCCCLSGIVCRTSSLLQECGRSKLENKWLFGPENKTWALHLLCLVLPHHCSDVCVCIYIYICIYIYYFFSNKGRYQCKYLSYSMFIFVSRASNKLNLDIYIIKVMKSNTCILLCSWQVSNWLANFHFIDTQSREKYLRPTTEEDTDKHTVAEPYWSSGFTHILKHFPK